MKPIVIRVSLGDIQYLTEVLWFAVKTRQWSVIRKGWWVYRETIRRGSWRPWTLGDFILLQRKKKHMKQWPRQTPWPKPWRHR